MSSLRCRLAPWICVLSVACAGCAGRAAPASGEKSADPRGPSIELNALAAPQASFDVLGIDNEDLSAIDKLDRAAQAELLRVYVADAGDDAPAMVGETSVADGRLRFTPRYPLQPGMRYRAVLRKSALPRGSAEADDLVVEFKIPERPPQPEAVVTHIYPSADRLPENQLKFYLHFSAPMSRGEAYRHIHLLDADGKEVEAPFLELGEELWDPAMRRFTLLCDPGRIKRGLKPREEVGPVLEEGKHYTLVVDRQWHDATGQPLGEEARKPFEAGPPDNEPLDTGAWQIEPPPAGERGPLVVRLPEPLDRAMLERVLRVVDASGNDVSGSIDVEDGETEWRFTPHDPWQAGNYQLLADTTLEDLAGNSIGRAFDVDVFEPVQKRIETKTISIPFVVKQP